MICARCRFNRPLSGFYVRPDGTLRKPCSACISLKNAEYRSTHKEQIHEQKRLANKKNPHANRARVRAWQKANRERVNESIRRRRSTPESIAKRQEYYIKNKARVLRLNCRRHLARQKSDSNYLFLVRARTRICRALRGNHKHAGTVALLGASIQATRAHIESQFKPGMTWDNWGEWHVDHKKPCNTFDLSDPEQQRACFSYTNLRPLWKLDNLRRPKDGSDQLLCPTQP